MSDETDEKVKINITKKDFDGWLVDLRSGQFKQGPRRLCRKDPVDGEKTYCCLGVLGERMDLLHEANDGDIIAEGQDDEYLPYGLIDELTQQELSQLNDDERLPFPEIADYIEKNLTPKL